MVPVDSMGTPPALGEEPARTTIRIGSDHYHLDLADLAAALKDQPQAHWRTALGDYFRRRPWPPYERQELVSGGVDRARSLLRIMMHTADEVPRDLDPVTTVLGAGLVAVLCVHGRYSPYWIWRTEARRWGVDPAELWAIALHNVRREAPELTRMGSGYALLGDSQYTAANLLRLDELVREPTPHGMLVIAPSRHVVVFCPITGGSVLVHATTLHGLADTLAGKAGGPALTRKVMWRSAGRLTEITLTETGERITSPDDPVPVPIWEVAGPVEFVNLVYGFVEDDGTGRDGR